MEDELSFRVDLADSYDKVLKKAKDGKTSTKTLISFWEGRASASEAFAKAMGKLGALDKLGEQGSFEDAWKTNMMATNLYEVAHTEFAFVIKMNVVAKMNELLEVLRKEKAKFEKMEQESHARVSAAEASLKKAQSKVQTALVNKKKLESTANANPKNLQKYKAAEAELISFEKLQTDAEEVLATITENHRKTMSIILESLHKLEVDRMNKIQSILKTAAEADMKLVIKTTAAANSSVEAFQTIDIQKDVNSFILKTRNASTESPAIPNRRLSDILASPRTPSSPPDMPSRSPLNSPLTTEVPAYIAGIDENAVDETHIVMDMSSFLAAKTNSPPPLPDALHSPTITSPSVNVLPLNDLINLFKISSENEGIKKLAYEDVLLSFNCDGPVKLSRDHEHYFIFTHIRATLGISMNDHNFSFKIAEKSLSATEAFPIENKFIANRFKMLQLYPILHENSLPDAKWRRLQLSYLLSEIENKTSKEEIFRIAHEIDEATDVSKYKAAIDKFLVALKGEYNLESNKQLNLLLLEVITLSLFDSSDEEEDVNKFILHAKSEEIFKLSNTIRKHFNVTEEVQRIFQMTHAYRFSMENDCNNLVKGLLSSSSSGAIEKPNEVKKVLETRILNIIENNVSGYRTIYDNPAIFQNHLNLFLQLKKISFQLDNSLPPIDNNDLIQGLIERALKSEYDKLLPENTSRPIADLVLVANLTDAMAATLPDAIQMTGNFFTPIVKEQKLKIHIPTVVLNCIMNLVREDVEKSLAISNSDNVGGEGIIQLYRGLLSFENTCFKVNGLDKDQRLCPKSIDKLDDLLKSWLKQVVSKSEQLINRAATEDNYEPHTVRGVPGNGSPSSSIIDVASLIGKTIENVETALGGEQLPSSGIISFTDSMIDVVLKYFHKLSTLAGVQKIGDVIPPIPPYPVEATTMPSISSLSSLSAKSFIKMGKQTLGQARNTIKSAGKHEEVVQNAIEIDYASITRCLIMLNNLLFASSQIGIIKKRLLDLYLNSLSKEKVVNPDTTAFLARFNKIYEAITKIGNEIAKTVAIQVIFKDLQSEILGNLYRSDVEVPLNLTDFLCNFDQVVVSISERVSEVWFPTVLKNLFEQLEIAWHRTLLNSGRFINRGTTTWEYSDGGVSWQPYPTEVQNGLEESFNEGRGAVNIKSGINTHYVTFDNMLANVEGRSFQVRRVYGQFGTDLKNMYLFFSGPDDGNIFGLPMEYTKSILKEVELTMPLLHQSSASIISKLDKMNLAVRSRAQKILHHRDDKEAKKYCKSVR